MVDVVVVVVAMKKGTNGIETLPAECHPLGLAEDQSPIFWKNSNHSGMIELGKF